MGRAEEIREQIATKVATFKVGDNIRFHVYDDSGCNERTGDPIEIELIGTILKIEGTHATVEHKYGICSAWLAIAKHVEQPSE